MRDTYDDTSTADGAVLPECPNSQQWYQLLCAAIWLLNNPSDWPGGQDTARLEEAVKALIPGWNEHFRRST